MISRRRSRPPVAAGKQGPRNVRRDQRGQLAALLPRAPPGRGQR